MSKHALIGDNFGTDLPQVQVDKTQLDVEKKAAKYSKTKEFEQLKEHFEQRIKYYQSFLPSGKEIEGDPSQLVQNWIVANKVIAEFQAVIDYYDNAAKTVDENG